MRWQGPIFSILLSFFFSFQAWGSVCSASLTTSYLGLFNLALRTPYLTPDQAKIIANSPVPMNPLADAPRNEQTHALKQGFQQTLGRMKPKLWPTIQEALRLQLSLQQEEKQQIEAAKESTKVAFVGSATAVKTPNAALHPIAETHITWADRAPGDRLYFSGGAQHLNIIEEQTRVVRQIPTRFMIVSSIEIHQAEPNRWLLLLATQTERGGEYVLRSLEFNPLKLEFGKETVLASPQMHGSNALDFKTFLNLAWVLSPNGELYYFFTNGTGTFFGRPNSTEAPLRLDYTMSSIPRAPKILRLKGGRVIVATVGVDSAGEMYLMTFEPFKSLTPMRKLREPEMAYFNSPDLVQYKGRVYVAINGRRKNTETSKEDEFFTDIWDLSSSKNEIRSWTSNPAWLRGAPQFLVTSKGRLLMGQRYQGSIHSFHMEIFAPLEQNDPIYEVHTGFPKSPSAADSEHFPKMIENIYGELLIAGVDRMERNFVIFKPETSRDPIFTYNFGEHISTSPTWSPSPDGRLNVIFSDQKDQTHFIEVMKSTLVER